MSAVPAGRRGRGVLHRAVAALAVAMPLTLGGTLSAQDPDQRAALGVATAALQAITDGDAVAFTDLMVEGAVLFPTGRRDGRPMHTVRTREAQREGISDSKIVERGFDGEARVAGEVATVWLPYDLYVDGAWSHCGVDVFTLVRTESGWRIASLAWSVEQPPACARHPSGPPGA